MTHAEAVRKTKREGWVHAPKGLAEAFVFARLLCLQEKAIFEWAQRHDVDLSDNRERLLRQYGETEMSTPLFTAVLADLSLEAAEAQLKGDA